MFSERPFTLPRWVFCVVFTIVLSGFMTGCLTERVKEKVAGADGGASCSALVWNGFQGTPTANANWDYIQPTILGGRGFCKICHTRAGTGPSNLSWDSDQYSHIVTDRLMSGYPSSGLPIIEPGFKDCSFAYRKISESDSELVAAGEGSRMPLEKPPLSAADIALIGAWIDEGAVLAAP
jgi:hypothetical protein